MLIKAKAKLETMPDGTDQRLKVGGVEEGASLANASSTGHQEAYYPFGVCPHSNPDPNPDPKT